MTSPGTALNEAFFHAASSTIHEPWAILLMTVLCLIWRCVPHLFQHVIGPWQQRKTATQIGKMRPKQASQANEALRAMNGLPAKENRE